LKSPAPNEIEAEFAETLRQAAYIFETEKNGRFLGSIIACRAVVRFIHRRDGAAELAGPFLQIAAAFEELERGGKPRLFAKKTIPKKERERSPERKHMQMLAAALLDVSMQLKSKDAGVWSEEKKAATADRVARHVNDWPNMENQQVTGRTVIGWRNNQKGLSEAARRPFDTVVAQILGAETPQAEVDRLLRYGPPGQFRD